LGGPGSIIGKSTIKANILIKLSGSGDIVLTVEANDIIAALMVLEIFS
jgi:hypothetical protein